MTLPSTHQSPTTVNRKASVLTMGTVRLSSKNWSAHTRTWGAPGSPPGVASITHRGKKYYSPALPISRKNQTLPVRLISKGAAYRGFRSRSTTAKKARYTFAFSQLARTVSDSRIGCAGGWWSFAALRMKGVVRPQAIPTSVKPRM